MSGPQVSIEHVLVGIAETGALSFDGAGYRFDDRPADRELDARILRAFADGLLAHGPGPDARVSATRDGWALIEQLQASR